MLRSYIGFAGFFSESPTRSGEAIVIALLLTIACAVFISPRSAAGQEKTIDGRFQFDLVCKGVLNKYTRDSAPPDTPVESHDNMTSVYSLDLRKKQFFFQDYIPLINQPTTKIPMGPYDIERFTSDKITLNRANAEMTINRRTGDFSYTDKNTRPANYPWYFSSWGECSKAPFTPFPKPQF